MLIPSPDSKTIPQQKARIPGIHPEIRTFLYPGNDGGDFREVGNCLLKMLLLLHVILQWQPVKDRPGKGHFIRIFQLTAKGNAAGDGSYFYRKVF